ncbi:MAG TPA: septal ring lytic transglycosylase RlpA family protein [Stellaceae bacterium]|nr:septal ring lytic transglycosylase RlpA family protein [Stellaceae bacterium]
MAISGLALAKQSFAAEERQQQPPSLKAKTAKTDHRSAQHAAAREHRHEGEGGHAAPLHNAKALPEDKIAGGSKPAREDRLSGASQSPAALKALGHQEIGIAAWYGGRFLGGRTASGAVLDNQTPTAAHRSLPLNSLVRVTNLRNGRSVICKVNDRGPWGRNRLIDVSPRAADELDMKRSGIARVSVEPVASAAHAGAD